MTYKKRGGDDVASCPAPPLELEAAPPPETSPKEQVLAAVKYIHRTWRGEKLITPRAVAFFSDFDEGTCRKVLEELEREGYLVPVAGGWKYAGKK